MNRIIRIIDANTNRAREGLRVIEDIARFVLDDKESASEFKNLRHEITEIIAELPLDKWEFLKSRKSSADVGAFLNNSGENNRSDIIQIAVANIHRAQESMRVLEELTKLYSPESGLKFKSLRFRMYELEKMVIPKLQNHKNK
ncbi:thiamine-phosphate pyrophosphorylase [Candidatus Poribacteria bacterium]|nr:thiamine-phosphate pyrophosphorylase [Candidatus Poribacteria bacterium]